VAGRLVVERTVKGPGLVAVAQVEVVPAIVLGLVGRPKPGLVEVETLVEVEDSVAEPLSLPFPLAHYFSPGSGVVSPTLHPLLVLRVHYSPLARRQQRLSPQHFSYASLLLVASLRLRPGLFVPLVLVAGT
jgi:hypothetical protein